MNLEAIMAEGARKLGDDQLRTLIADPATSRLACRVLVAELVSRKWMLQPA